MKKNIICLDTNILVWGIQQVALPQYQDRIERTQLLFQQLHQDKAEIIIPSVVLSEFLMGIEKIEVAKYFKEINKFCKIYSFDTAVAFKLSEIFQNIKQDGLYEELKNEGRTKQCIKFDSMIIATAIIQRASIIYTYDGGVKKIAEKEGIEVRNLPELTEKIPEIDLLSTTVNTNKTLQ